MEKQITLRIGAVLLLAALNFSQAEVIPTYFEVGGKLTMRPNVKETITNILWKYNGNLLAEWVKDEVDLFYYDKYQNRTTMSTATGQLEIERMEKEDVGLYTVEINNRVHGQSYDVKWITRVPKPTVVFRPLTCGPGSESCSVICNGQEAESLSDAEPIKYSWKMGDKAWEMKMKDITVTRAETETESIKTISCRMKNPVSQEDSELMVNPMYKEPPIPPTPVGLIVGALVVLVLILAAVFGLLWLFKRELVRGLIRRCGCGNDPESGKGAEHHLVPTHDSPNSSTEVQPKTSTEAQPNNSTEAQPNKSTEAQPNNSTEAQPNKSTEAQPNDSTEAQPNNSTEAQPNKSTEAQPNDYTEVQPNNSTEAPTDSTSEVQLLNPPVKPSDLPTPDN